jgi:hypothetical protein
MAAGDPIQGIDVSIGKRPRPKGPGGGPRALAFDVTGGTAVVLNSASEYGSLMALRGQILAEWSVVYPPGPETEAVAYNTTRFMMNNTVGCTRVKFLRVQIVGVSHVGGAVEVTLNYGAVQRLPLGGNVLPSAGGPLFQAAAVKSRSNVRNN